MLWLRILHPGEPPDPYHLLAAWNAAPGLVLPLAGLALAYAWGVRRVWQRAGKGHGIPSRRVIYFCIAILALALALVSPLDAMSASLFSAHMAQHLILILLAAPMLVMSDIPVALLWALPRNWAQAVAGRWKRARFLPRAWKLVSGPVGAWVLFTLAMWVWHAPALYEAALHDETIHAVEHLFFLLTSSLFWWVLVRQNGPAALRYGAAIPYLFLTILQSGVLGALMTFTEQPWYPYYARLVDPWGMTPLQDQQLAGVIMWIPAGLVFTLLTIGYFAAWLRALEQRSAG